MRGKPKISVVVPNFNKGQLVLDCLESVKRQTFEDWELIFIDDHSDDNSYELAQAFAGSDSRIKVRLNQTEIKGANSCRNQGITDASANYILFFDSDDLMLENCLEERWQDLKSKGDECILVHQTGLFFDELYDSCLVCNVESDENYLDRFLARDLVWLISGPLWPKSILQKLGGFDLSLKSHQEYDLHVRALISGCNFKFLNKKPKVFYRQNVISESRKRSQSVEHLRARTEMAFNHLKLLKQYKLLNEKRKILVARYLLDISQMMRWHKIELGKGALEYALSIWEKVFQELIITRQIYSMGRRYIQFKHQMFFNRVPLIQKNLDALLQKRLTEYIHKPSKTYCKTEYKP